MTFLIDYWLQAGTSGRPDFAERLDEYRAYLESVRARMPPAAYDFAAAPWHYDFSDHRCPHDSWVESLTISEPSSGERGERRGLGISVRLLGAYHDGHIELLYDGVESYALGAPSEFAGPPLGVGHGDWLIDEVRMSSRQLVVHEVAFSRGARWLITCRDVSCRWSPTRT